MQTVSGRRPVTAQEPPQLGAPDLWSEGQMTPHVLVPATGRVPRPTPPVEWVVTPTRWYGHDAAGRVFVIPVDAGEARPTLLQLIRGLWGAR